MVPDAEERVEIARLRERLALSPSERLARFADGMCTLERLRAARPPAPRPTS